MIYEFNITLEDVGVPVSRKVHIKKDASFYELHELIQAAFDWTASHLYGFYVLKTNGIQKNGIEITADSAELLMEDSKQVIYRDKTERLSEWIKKPKDLVRYIYDYGDSWAHMIELVREVKLDKTTTYPVCIAAENIAPPEDSRFELIEGSLNLIAKDNQLLLMDVNEDIEYWEPYFDDLMPDTHLSEEEKTYEEWELTLQTAKEFLQKKPWENLKEQDIFAVKDPESRRIIFCTVIGHSENQFGLAAYIGMEGFFTLLEIMSGEEEVSFDGLQQGHSLFVTFEDRHDIDEKDYELIKAHSTMFRGKKSWPIFTSLKPGFVPWTMNEEEARLTRLMMTESLKVMDEQEHGLTIPFIPRDEKILLRETVNPGIDSPIFTSHIVEVEELLDDDEEEEVMLSEFEIKRLNKLVKPLSFSIEFSIVPLAVPVQIQTDERPFYPFIAVAVDAETGQTYYQEMLENHLDTYYGQKALLQAF